MNAPLVPIAVTRELADALHTMAGGTPLCGACRHTLDGNAEVMIAPRTLDRLTKIHPDVELALRELIGLKTN